MSYLFVNNQEIKNDSGNPIPITILHSGDAISGSNPLPVQMTNATINIGAEVEVSNDSGNPIPVSGTVSITGPITLDSTSLSSLENINASVTGTVSVDNFPAFPVVQTVSLDSSSRNALENITATVTFPEIQLISGTVTLDSNSLVSLENINADITGTVSVDNFPAFPAVQTVSLDSSSREALENIAATVSGTVSVDNFPTVQTITGTVSLDSGSLISLENVTVNVESSVEVSNFPSVQTVSLDSSSREALENINAIVSFPSVQTVSLDSSSREALENIAATVSGTVSVDNFPAFPIVQTVSLDSSSREALENINASVTGTVTVDNFPAFPAVQTVSLDSNSREALENINATVSGSVSVDNFPAFPAVQTVSLDSSSREALENINAIVSFPSVQTVSLDSSSREALENINATVSGTVSIDNFPSVQTVSLDSSSREALENISATVSGTVSVDNFPAFPVVQTVSLDSSSKEALENINATVTGTVTVDNFPVFPSVQTVSLDSSSREALENITALVTFPSVQTVSLDSSSREALENINASVTGTVSVDNFPAFPAVQTVSLDSSSREALENINATVSGTVSVDNFPAFPSIQIVSLDSSSREALENISATVSGSVSVDNFPAFPSVQTVSLDSSSREALENINATVSGTVAVSSLPEVEIKNDSNNPISISRNTTQNSESNPIFVKGTSDATFFNPTQLDAFGRLRVSEPYTLFDNSFRYGDNIEKWNTKTSGNATVAYSQFEGVMLLSTLANGDSIIRETTKVFQYQPGKSLLIMNTFSMGPPADGLVMKVGYYGKDNGIFLERDGNTINIVKRSSVTGSPIDTKIPQSSWNGDKLNGTGASGHDLGTMSTAQILWTDIEWLGVGSVRVGFVIDGNFIVAHTFHHANDVSTTYMTTATLPIRYEVSTTSGGGIMRQICSTVISEGGYTALSLTRSASTALAGKAISNVAYTPLINIRLRSGKTDSVVLPHEIQIYGLSQSAYKYAIIKKPTLTSPTWNLVDSSSSVQYDISSTALTGGIIVQQGFFVGDNKGGQTTVNLTNLNHSLQLSRDIINSDSEGHVLSLAVISTTNNDLAVGSISWQEHS
jgi:hypothetical protein